MNLADKAYELLKEEIITCVLQPGQQIAQTQLAEKYQVGTTPVREALQRLVHEGLVQAVPRSGYVVSHITLSDVRELFELRNVLESAAVRMACARASEQQLAWLADHASFSYKYSDHADYVRFLARNHEFHCAIAAMSGNQRLTDTLSRVLAELNRVFHLGLDLRDSADEMRSEHIVLAEALSRRDAEQAAAIVNAQIARSIQRVQEALTRSVGPGSSGFPTGNYAQGIQTMILGEKPE